MQSLRLPLAPRLSRPGHHAAHRIEQINAEGRASHVYRLYDPPSLGINNRNGSAMLRQRQGDLRSALAIRTDACDHCSVNGERRNFAGDAIVPLRRLFQELEHRALRDVSTRAAREITSKGPAHFHQISDFAVYELEVLLREFGDLSTDIVANLHNP